MWCIFISKLPLKDSFSFCLLSQWACPVVLNGAALSTKNSAIVTRKASETAVKPT